MSVPLPGGEVPRQVPAPPVTFVDRDGILAWLSDQLADPGRVPRIAVVAGAPGIGKRTAARRWVHESRARFPGGDLQVDCGEFGSLAGEGAADVSGMVASCLRALGCGDRYMPAGLAERVRLFRTRTARAPVLVLVENATEPGQVTPVIPNAPGSVVLVTTAADLGELRLDGAGFYDLGRLDEVSGAELLGKVCGARRVAAEPQSAADLVRWCAGLPIAIVVLAARVASTRGLAMAELAGELADEARRLPGLALGGKATVSSAFTASYERLPAPAQRLYRRLGLLPGADFSPEVAGVVAGTGPREARQLLDVLVSAYLVEFTGGRYGFHDLMRLHARERAQEEPAERREAAVHAVVEHYLVRAAFADRAVMGARARVTDHDVLLAGHDDPFAGSEPARRALAWLDSERASLVPVTRAAFTHGWDSEAWQLAEALTGYYYNHRHLTDWVTASGLGARAARRCGNLRAQARLRIAVSRAYTDLGELDRASSELDTAADLAQRSGDLVLQASAWEFRGRFLDATAPQQAPAAYEQAHDLNARAGEWRGAALVVYFTGCSLEAAGQHVKALEALGRALDMLRWLRDSRMTGRALIAIGTAQAGLGRTADAVASLEEAVRELAGLHYEAQAREILASIAGQAGDHDAEQQQLRRAVAIYASGGHPRAEELAARLDPAQP